MNSNLKSARLLTTFFLLGTGLILGLNGCAEHLVHFSATANMLESQGPYPTIDTDKVTYFPSKEDLPVDLHKITVAELISPEHSNWSYEELLTEFQKKAGELGANVIVLERVDTENGEAGNTIYKGRGIAYRFYRDNPTEFLNLTSYYKATQVPDRPIAKTKVLYSYPGIK